mgnify:CR=1 FL=1
MSEIESQSYAKSPVILDKYSKEIDAALYKAISVDNVTLLNMMRYHIGWVDAEGQMGQPSQGKGLRSSLCVFSCESVGGKPQDALPIAAAIELIHNFSLIHDDIQDGDLERRHRPTVWVNWGKPKALQAGNVMRVLADMAPGEYLALDENFARVSRCSLVLTSACLDMIEGQYLDLYFEGRTDIDTSKYLEMVSRKTGALIRCAMQLGAIVGNADDLTINAMAECGRYMGNIFQIRDDYLGIWGKEEYTGKAVGNDIRKKKNSLPIVFANERSGSDERKFLQDTYLQDQIQDYDVANVISVLEKVNAKRYVQDIAEREARLALKSLDQAKMSDDFKEDIDELITFLLYRES